MVLALSLHGLRFWVLAIQRLRLRQGTFFVELHYGTVFTPVTSAYATVTRTAKKGTGLDQQKRDFTFCGGRHNTTTFVFFS